MAAINLSNPHRWQDWVLGQKLRKLLLRIFKCLSNKKHLYLSRGQKSMQDIQKTHIKDPSKSKNNLRRLQILCPYSSSQLYQKVSLLINLLEWEIVDITQPQPRSTIIFWPPESKTYLLRTKSPSFWCMLKIITPMLACNPKTATLDIVHLWWRYRACMDQILFLCPIMVPNNHHSKMLRWTQLE